MTSPEENSVSNTETSSPEAPAQAVVEQPELPPAEQQLAPDVAEVHTAEPQTAARARIENGETLTQSLLSIIVIVLFVITFVVQAFQIPSESMEKTLLIGDYLLVDKIHFGQGGLSDWIMPYRSLKRGDIIVFHYPVDPSQHFVKRVIGLPGDHILMRNKVVFVDDMALNESYAVRVPGDHNFYRDNFPSDTYYSPEVDAHWRTEMPKHIEHGELVVPKDMYFVMGDNRDHSLDSRYWGFVPRDNIVGRPLVIYLSLRENREGGSDAGNGKLLNSGRLLTHVWQFARWDRMFHLVR